ncbi:hypothetical protein SAMN05192562_11035 [Kosakonia arachidis]|uniref:Uncharacterized protein n=1 Tax=Kosakonia arachidis TaxID=551989 RepID=A0A1I7E5A1_9ENTR|nr:hypothetical protein [Kosakonia arachidis]SFU19092.1 hypothetical protein SAMN05192562_11035 [Kosakonia arachidis]
MRFATFPIPFQTGTCLKPYSARSLFYISTTPPQINYSTKIKIGVSHQSGRHGLPNTTKQHTAKELNGSSLIFEKYIITMKQYKKEKNQIH